MQNKKVAIYTVIFGGYDDLKEDLSIASPKNVDFYVITDNKNIKTHFYQPIIKPILYDSPQKTARYYKIVAHTVFSGYSHVFFHDGSIMIKLNMVDELLRFIGRADFMGYHHHMRNCAYAEALNCKRYAFEYSQIINQQLSRMKEMKFPKKRGLFETGFIYRNLSNDKIVELNNKWWEEVNNYSLRDQISLPYLLFELNITFKFLEGKLRLSPYFVFQHSHNANRRIKHDSWGQFLAYKIFTFYFRHLRKYSRKLIEKSIIIYHKIKLN